MNAFKFIINDPINTKIKIILLITFLFFLEKNILTKIHIISNFDSNPNINTNINTNTNLNNNRSTLQIKNKSEIQVYVSKYK